VSTETNMARLEKLTELVATLETAVAKL